MNSNKYSIIFIMDESGSMVNMGNEPWQGLNNFVNKQKENNIEFNFTLIFFNSNIRFIHKNLNSEKISMLTKKDYNPEGLTALYDAIGKGIEYQKTQSIDNVIFVILTDGLENSSQEYNKTSIQKLIKELETENKWEFVYLGANQDAFKVGNSIGIESSFKYEYTPSGFRNVMESISTCVSNKITGVDENISFK
jgi:uncharacterized protein with von Willebrand factor type A (vWA) domain